MSSSMAADDSPLPPPASSPTPKNVRDDLDLFLRTPPSHPEDDALPTISVILLSKEMEISEGEDQKEKWVPRKHLHIFEHKASDYTAFRLHEELCSSAGLRLSGLDYKHTFYNSRIFSRLGKDEKSSDLVRGLMNHAGIPRGLRKVFQGHAESNDSEDVLDRLDAEGKAFLELKNEASLEYILRWVQSGLTTCILMVENKEVLGITDFNETYNHIKNNLSLIFK